MEQLYVVQIKNGNNSGEYLVKYCKGFYTSKNIGLRNLYHNKDDAEIAAKAYIKETNYAETYINVEDISPDLVEFYKQRSLHGKLYEVITFNLVREVEDK